MEMKRLLLTCTFLFAVSNAVDQVPPFTEKCVHDAYPPKESLKIPTFTLNLDLPPSQRWTNIVKQKSPQIKTLMVTIKEFLLDISNKTAKIINSLDGKGEKVCNTLPEPFGDEMRGIANATGLPLGEVVLFNIFYEVFTVCTSIIAEDPSGKLFHARNLDFGLFMGWDVKNHTWEITEILRPLVINVDYQKGGKTLFKAVHFAGYIGVLTAIKPDVFTLSMNERFNKDGGYIGIIEWILGMRTGQWMGFLTRNVMEQANSFAEAKLMLSTTEMLAPAYYILAGNSTGQGCVITRARESAVDIWDIKEANGWYVLETNYDHWEKPLFVDDRRTPAHKCMKGMTQEATSFKGLFNVLSSKPVLNKLTTYTALMQVNSGTLETWLQYCSDPCWPF